METPRPMDLKALRLLIPLAPATLRPILAAVCDWMQRTDARLEALERRGL